MMRSVSTRAPNTNSLGVFFLVIDPFRSVFLLLFFCPPFDDLAVSLERQRLVLFSISRTTYKKLSRLSFMEGVLLPPPILFPFFFVSLFLGSSNKVLYITADRFLFYP
jgi:hypothetical protein